MKKIILLVVVCLLSGCAATSLIKEQLTGNQFDDPIITQPKFLNRKENALRPPKGGPIPIAVYSFTDKTGQRKYVENFASFSTAVTQGAEGYVIKALQDVGDGRWFKVIERVGLENLVKERQMIRQMREAYQGKEAQPLPPMVFAGIILEGGIVGYDSNLVTGGAGATIFNIGATTQYQSDTVTINLRTVSVSTGEILTNVTVSKTVLSYMDKLSVMKWISSGTQTLEAELGGSINESINKAIDVTVQSAVIQTINDGARKGHWAFKEELTDDLKLETNEEIKIEPKVEVLTQIKEESTSKLKDECKLKKHNHKHRSNKKSCGR